MYLRLDRLLHFTVFTLLLVLITTACSQPIDSFIRLPSAGEPQTEQIQKQPANDNQEPATQVGGTAQAAVQAAVQSLQGTTTTVGL
ncbi:MAG TPA: hypothetical protein PKE45_13650, partial [Caldilineaceae bacterium]|nr:hypothetical protein [Caldilineaceae bacterium]